MSIFVNDWGLYRTGIKGKRRATKMYFPTRRKNTTVRAAGRWMRVNKKTKV